MVYFIKKGMKVYNGINISKTEIKLQIPLPFLVRRYDINYDEHRVKWLQLGFRFSKYNPIFSLFVL